MPYRFKAIPSPSQPASRPFEKLLKTGGKPGKDAAGVQGARFSDFQGMETPKEIGVFLTPEKFAVNRGIPSLPTHGVFRFKGAWSKDVERIPIHFLVSIPDVRELDVNTVWIPRAQCKFQDGFYMGRFTFDLANLFIAPADGKAKPPKEAWISVVHRGWVGAIGKFSFSIPPNPDISR
jgi:hypothetical protein